MDGDTVTIWPGAREMLIDDLDERTENRNQSILDAIEFYLILDDVLGDVELFAKADDRDRRAMLRQALIDYRTEYLDE